MGHRGGGLQFGRPQPARTRFEQCAITGCRFASALTGAVFDGRQLEGRPALGPLEADFTGAVFDQMEFMGFDLSRVTFQQDPDLRLYGGTGASLRALASLHGDASLPAGMLCGELTYRLKTMRGTDPESNVLTAGTMLFQAEMS